MRYQNKKSSEKISIVEEPVDEEENKIKKKGKGQRMKKYLEDMGRKKEDCPASSFSVHTYAQK